MRGKKALYNIVTNFILQIVIVVYGFVVPKIIISKFGSDVNGLVASITQFLAYISLLESGFGPVVKSVLYRPIATKNKKAIEDILRTSEKFFRRIALLFVVYIVFLFFVYPTIINGGFAPLFTISLIAIIGISTFAEYFFGMTYRLYLQAEQKTYIVSIIHIVSYILSIIAVVILAMLGADIFIIKLVSGLLFVLRPLLQNIYVKKKYDLRIKNGDSNYKIKQKWDGLAQHFAAVIHANTDITVLTIFCALSEVSVYSVYYLVIAGVRKVSQSFNNGVDASFGDMIARAENDNLRKKFSTYELFYIIITTITFGSALLLITPFVSVYTRGINDANYIRPIFGYLLVIGEFIWAVRQPYNELVKAAGNFRQTRIGAWIECLTNIIISVILVSNFGLIGVAIGTMVAMAIRTAEFVYHSNKYILNRSMSESVKKIILAVFAIVVIAFICNSIPLDASTGYGGWIVSAVVIVSISSFITVVLYGLLFKEQTKYAVKIIKRIIWKRKR